MTISMTTVGMLLLVVALVQKFGYLTAGLSLIGFSISLQVLSYLLARANASAKAKAEKEMYRRVFNTH